MQMQSVIPVVAHTLNMEASLCLELGLTVH